VARGLREKHSLRVRVVSFPCQRLFEEQSKEYRREVLQRHKGVPCVVVEAYSAMGWERYADAAVCMSTKRFGKSLPGPKAYEYFGFTSEKIVPKVMSWLEDANKEEGSREFVEIFEDREE
jgi:dihydroxyacetone synthase